MRPFSLSSNQRLSKRRVATLSAQRARPDRCRNTERASWKRRAARRGSDSAAAICRRHQATAGSSSTVVAGPQGRRRARTPVEMPYDHELIASIDTDRTRKFGAASSGPLKDPFAMQATFIEVRAGTGATDRRPEPSRWADIEKLMGALPLDDALAARVLGTRSGPRTRGGWFLVIASSYANSSAIL
jgi:hypothetical protein